MLTHCELFGGIGGFSYAAREWFPDQIRTTGYCDIDESAIAVYRSHFPDVPIHRDIRNFFPTRGEYDLLTITFPCTGTSDAGNREGFEHPESGLWREGLRVMCEARPKFAIWEQPMGVVDRGLRAILGGCRMAGYKTEVEIISAGSCGASHNRERIFVIAYDDRQCGNGKQPTEWSKQIREEVRGAWATSEWLKVKRSGDGDDDGVSCQLVRGDRTLATINPTCKPWSKGRNKARILLGKTVCPPQARIALSRVCYLEAAK